MDWNYWLGRKYANLEAGTSADTTRANATLIDANANANLNTVRAGLLPKESAANVANTNAQTSGILETNKTIAPLATASIGLSSANAKNAISQAGLYGAQTQAEDQSSATINSLGLGTNPIIARLLRALGGGLQPSQ